MLGNITRVTENTIQTMSQRKNLFFWPHRTRYVTRQMKRSLDENSYGFHFQENFKTFFCNVNVTYI